MPWPRRLARSTSPRRARRAEDAATCDAYLEAREAFAQACADPCGAPALALLDDAAAPLRRRLRAGQGGARRPSTSTTSSCCARDLLRRARRRPRRPARERFERDHGRRVPGHQPAASSSCSSALERRPRCSSSATSSSRSTASATPTSSSSATAARALRSRGRGARAGATNFRARPEILDARQRARSRRASASDFAPLRRRGRADDRGRRAARRAL